MKKILVPTDFSENAANALEFAAAIAAQTRATLLLAHVVELPVMASAEAPVLLPPDPEVVRHYQDRLKEIAKQQQLKHDFRFTTAAYCVEGSLYEQLPNLIVKEQVELVVMGTQGATNLLDRFIGTNTAAFIKHAPCPVLAIPANARFAGIKSVAYASDFKTEEEVYLKQLFAFTAPFNPEVVVVNVLTEDREETLSASRIRATISSLYPTSQYSLAQVQGRSVVAGITTFVKENRMDVLAVSLHERNLINNLFHKSVSQELAYTSQIPLLALPQKPYQLKAALPVTSTATATK